MSSPGLKDHAGVVAFPPLIWAITALASGVLHFVRAVRLTSGQFALLLGITFALVALALLGWAALTMKAAGTNVHPGLPALTIARSGPYRFTRNPMYLGLCLLQLAVGFFLNDWLALLFVLPLALVLHFGVIRREEKYLEAKFGEQYLALKRGVRRWI